MAQRNNYCLSSNNINCFYLIKTLTILLFVNGDLVNAQRIDNEVASKTLTPYLRVDVGNIDLSTNNNCNWNDFVKNQIILKTLLLKADLALSRENCTINTWDSNTSPLTNQKGAETQLATVKPNTDSSTNTVTFTDRISLANVSTSAVTLRSQAKSSSSSSLVLQQKRLLSRPRRYLSFPEGSSFSVAVCFTVGIIGNPRYNYMSFGLNWGVAYDLPNTTWILNHLHGFAKRPIPVAAWHRRSRRSLYKEIENVVDNMGYNGRDCILRALCESRQYFQRTKMSMIVEMIRVIFSLPKQRIFTRELNENSDIELYDRAYRRAEALIDCSEQYDCGFSLLELAFGKYSTPPDGYYTTH